MTWDRLIFVRLEEAQGASVTFDDKNISKIIGKGNIEVPGIPTLTNVFYV